CNCCSRYCGRIQPTGPFLLAWFLGLFPLGGVVVLYASLSLCPLRKTDGLDSGSPFLLVGALQGNVDQAFVVIGLPKPRHNIPKSVLSFLSDVILAVLLLYSSSAEACA
ncbi:unnamed protein product, partial [Ectocarpus sp. 4 AP-2014]